MRRLCLWLAVCLALPATSAAAHKQPDPPSAFDELQRRDALIQNLGWRLLTRNARFCQRTRAATGLLLQDAGAYSDPTAARASAGVESDFYVQSVVPDSPADQAGIIIGAELHAIDGRPLSTMPISPTEPWLRLEIVRQRMAISLAQNSAVSLTLHTETAEPTSVAGAEICDSYLEIITNSESASTNGKRVAIGQNFAGFEYPEDELAAALAHELAHNFMDHPAWLKAKNAKRREIRQSEREADRLMPWLLANAGFEPAVALRFMRRWGPSEGGGLLRKRTHDGWDERTELIEAELPQIAASIAKHGDANWKQDFRLQFARD